MVAIVGWKVLVFNLFILEKQERMKIQNLT